ncbi:peptidyl-tRNA hydrolase [Maribacter vaceletii]|uniref:Peptidyl-tRNA hydrolase n=1 Tax=Maribacter vaceletii TaxID=1206816 RepID=A0A495ECB7_9FLAO|nr:aminoacyl-tRNA hydrolase [Maribacter vaceletii]RKR14466.1 peptidyl-tRNA hydrolase [Maribacter vaceletii]
MLSIIKLLFGKNITFLEELDIMKKFLIVGLGNIGNEYAETRHNIGFKVLDAFVADKEASFETQKLGDVAVVKIKGRSILCLKPSTYMNLSGKAIKYWMDKEKIPLENILIITDDINLEFGTFRLKTKGSDGGHNGLKSTQEVLQTASYNRFRFGVGADFGKGRQVDYVLGEWNAEENKALKERLEKASNLIASFVLSGVKNTMNQFNGK